MERSFIALFIAILALPGTSENASAGPLNDLPHFSTDSSGHSLAGEWLPAGGISGCNGQINAILPTSSGLVYLGGTFMVCGNVVVNHVAAYDPETDTFQALGNGIKSDDILESVHSLAIFDNDLYVGGNFWKAGDEHADNVARWDGQNWHTVGVESSGTNSPQSVYTLAASEDCLYAGGRFRWIDGKRVEHIACWDGQEWHALEHDGHSGVYGYNVRSLAVSGGNLFVGGKFTKAGVMPANNLARWDGERWHTLGPEENNGVDQEVYALTISETGLYVAGSFSKAGDMSAHRIARWDGAHWHTLENAGFNGVNDTVYALAALDSEVYVGGRFDEAGGTSANGVAKWDGANWHAIETSQTLGLSGSIRALALSNKGIYVGGFFRFDSGMPASNIARLNEGRWYVLEDSASAGISGWVVRAIAVSGEDLYVGGDFNMIGGVSANNIARWDGENWNALESGEFNGVGRSVNAIEVVRDKVYVGGSFTEAGGMPANYIAYWDGSEWGTLGDGHDNGVNDAVRALAVFGEDLYVGGSFRQAGEQDIGNIVRWDGNTWRLLGDDESNMIWEEGRINGVRAFAATNGNLYVGGTFQSAGDVPTRNIARWDGARWHALGDGDANGVRSKFSPYSEVSYYVDEGVVALAASDSDLYVGGWFTKAGDVPAVGIAQWDGENWHSLETGWEYSVDISATAIKVFPRVSALAVVDDKLYLGGRFPDAGGTNARQITHWDGSHWSSLGLGRQNGVSGTTNRLFTGGVSALQAQGNSVYVGGSFVMAGGEASLGIAEFLEHPDFSIEAGHTALWHSPERSGEGWVLEVLDPDTALFYWFTFDEHGRQRWMMDVGSIDGNRIVFEEMLYTHGGRPGHTDPDAVERPLAGQAVMTFIDCGSGAIEFEAFDQHHVINFERLTWSSGLPCGDDGSPSDDPRAALTGTWYDPAHSGEGFVLQWMANGEALVIWFTYDNDGNQQWIIGTGRTDGEEVVFSDLHVARGARFGGDFDPGDVEREEWGELRLTLNCESGVARWESVHPEYTDGQLNIEPLTRPDGLNCR